MSSNLAYQAVESADVATASDDYARRFEGPLGAWLIERQNSLVRDLLRDRGIAQSLDVGGGHGQLVAPFRELAINVTVLGSSAACDRQIRAHLGAGACSFSVGSLTQLAFPDSAFDLVSCIRFLSHCETWQNAVAEMCRVSRRYVLIDYPPWRSFNALSPLLFEVKRAIEGNTRTFTIFSNREIADTFARHGYRRVARHGQFFWPMGLHRALGAPGLSEALEQAVALIGLREYFGSPVLALFERS